ncbi:MAG: hypothetical protein ACXAEX_01470 [Promethearchaeota archaeon]|jgi:hypothetical protein
MVLDYNSNTISWKLYKALFQVIDVLSKFSDHYDKKLNFDNLASVLKLRVIEADEILALIMQFQGLFRNVFKDFLLEKKIEDNKTYLITKPRSNIPPIPRKIIITETHVKLLNDIIYLFKFVKRGQGFELDSRIQELCDYYPYLFQDNNGVLYPSSFGLKLGELIISYKKTNKTIKHFELDSYMIRVVEDD